MLAGGAEYFATHMKALGSENGSTFVVGAGDMIGGTPLLSGLFHDEPTIEFLNLIGTDNVGVGNHEFDEGRAELLRMQFGNQLGGTGCHPVDGCQDGTPFFGSMFGYLAANVVDEGTRNPILPPYAFVNTRAGKVAFIGETSREHSAHRHAFRRRGARLPRRGRLGERARARSSRRRARRRSCSCSTRAASRTRRSHAAFRT